ncbi:hypothetical protein EIP91_005883 [Steccherinum ochraceum]|uniref:F-box domain-containing protein n=1 Tax=Steccherinum ochraceum TaxID=92696 RepID=A0A4R0RCH4_9APHY|nr:hypothetical protein EIP91_005883 [Steccherinum ochraceum]
MLSRIHNRGTREDSDLGSLDDPPTALPWELVDLIFDHLDKPSLAICTLLCKFYHLSAREKLFHTVTICGATERFNFTNFLTFLWYPSTQGVALFIKELRMSSNAGRDYGSVHICTPYEIAHIVSKLPSLRTLLLTRLLLRRSEQQWTFPRTLHTLRLSHVFFDVPTWSGLPEFDFEPVRLDHTDNLTCGFADLLDLFTSIDTVRLSGVYAADYILWRTFTVRQQGGKYSTPVTLAYLLGKNASKTLRIKRFISENKEPQGSIYEVVLELLMTSHIVDSLEDLYIRDTATNARGLVQAAGKSLRRFHLHFDYGVIGSQAEWFQLHQCSNLSSLRLTTELVIPLMLPRQFAFSLGLMDHLPPKVSHFTMEWVCPRADSQWSEFLYQIGTLDWQRMDSVLTDPSRANLVSVNMKLINPTGGSNALVEFADEIASIRESLPRLCASNILSFH